MKREISTSNNGPVKIGIVGTGNMGGNHARILGSLPGAKLVGIFDSDLERAGQCAKQYETRSFPEYGELLADADAVIIAVPTDLHYSFSMEALEEGLDVLVEKPIADTLEQANKMCETALRLDRVLQVGHVERFNPVCLELTRLVKNPLLISCERLSSYTPSWIGTTGVIIDLMIHDLDIVLSLVGEDVTEVNAVSATVMSSTEDLALAQVVFKSGVIANFTSSRVSQAKIRRLSITQEGEFLSVDMLRQNISIHHHVVSNYFYDRRTGYRQEAVTDMPFLSRYGEPLRLELESFIDSVVKRTPPVVSGEDGTRALGLALRIMRECGLKEEE
ncbi:MAG: Gfo/Idh/MocA family oxidoreductase [Actinomycetia bacterium]|nr:Gfo/Idh/MocA family oxidoreductase [Actinomycetes bacterium]